MRDHLRLRLEPRGATLELLAERGLGVRLTREAAVAQMPELAFPLVARVSHLALGGGPCLLLLSGGGRHAPRASAAYMTMGEGRR